MAYDLVELEELKDELKIPLEDHKKDDDLERLIHRVSGLVEGFLGREILTRGEVTEVYTITTVTAEFHLNQWPVTDISAVYEDDTREYGATTELTDGTGYDKLLSEGLLIRLASGNRSTWSRWWRAVKVVYTAGYAVTAVPDVIKDGVLRACARAWQERTRESWGLVTQADGMGSQTRFAAAILSKDIKQDLWSEKRAIRRMLGERTS